MRGATMRVDEPFGNEAFQSTLLMRGATSFFVRKRRRGEYFNPRSSCEERRCESMSRLVTRHFNPRSSCEERLSEFSASISCSIFQSTLLMRGATSQTAYSLQSTQFQSTLLMRGATKAHDNAAQRAYHFNPRSSCEERPRRKR